LFGRLENLFGARTKLILSLALLELWVLFVDDVELALAADNLAINGTLLDGWFDFHVNLFLSTKIQILFVAVNDSPASQIVGRHFDRNFVSRQDSDVVHPHFARNGSKNNVPVLQPHFEICI
jgi:hypothetical protein